MKEYIALRAEDEEVGQTNDLKPSRSLYNNTLLLVVGLTFVLLLAVYLIVHPKPSPKISVDISPFRVFFRSGSNFNDKDPVLNSTLCPIPIIYTTDKRAADAVIWDSDSMYTSGSLDDLQQRRYDYPYVHQVISGVESAANRQVLQNYQNDTEHNRANRTFHAQASYRLDSSVPQTYAYDFFDFSREPVPWHEKRQDKIAAAFITNCNPKNARTRVLEELMRLLPDQIDSFGSCLPNANARDELMKLGKWEFPGDGDRWNIKTNTIRLYKFAIAMENSNDIDYVTEKHYQALEQGSVPIHLGALNYNQTFLPAPNAALDLAAYLPVEYTKRTMYNDKQPEFLSEEARAGLARFAEHLKYLVSNQERYQAMLHWKKTDWTSTPFGQVVLYNTDRRYSLECRLAGALRGESWANTNFTLHDKHLRLLAQHQWRHNT